MSTVRLRWSCAQNAGPTWLDNTRRQGERRHARASERRRSGLAGARKAGRLISHIRATGQGRRAAATARAGVVGGPAHLVIGHDLAFARPPPSRSRARGGGGRSLCRRRQCSVHFPSEHRPSRRRAGAMATTVGCTHLVLPCRARAVNSCQARSSMRSIGRATWKVLQQPDVHQRLWQTRSSSSR